MKDLEISVAPNHDLWIVKTGFSDNITLFTEDQTDIVQIELTREKAEQIYNWLGEYLGK
jgi:hypothetical protein